MKRAFSSMALMLLAGPVLAGARKEGDRPKVESQLEQVHRFLREHVAGKTLVYRTVARIGDGRTEVDYLGQFSFTPPVATDGALQWDVIAQIKQTNYALDAKGSRASKGTKKDRTLVTRYRLRELKSTPLLVGLAQRLTTSFEAGQGSAAGVRCLEVRSDLLKLAESTVLYSDFFDGEKGYKAGARKTLLEFRVSDGALQLTNTTHLHDVDPKTLRRGAAGKPEILVFREYETAGKGSLKEDREAGHAGESPEMPKTGDFQVTLRGTLRKGAAPDVFRLENVGVPGIDHPQHPTEIALTFNREAAEKASRWMGKRVSVMGVAKFLGRSDKARDRGAALQLNVEASSLEMVRGDDPESDAPFQVVLRGTLREKPLPFGTFSLKNKGETAYVLTGLVLKCREVSPRPFLIVPMDKAKDAKIRLGEVVRVAGTVRHLGFIPHGKAFVLVFGVEVHDLTPAAPPKEGKESES